MVHHRQRLAFCLKPGDDFASVHARLDDLQRDFAPDGRLLLGHVDDTKATLPDLLQQLVRSDYLARLFSRPLVRSADAANNVIRTLAGILAQCAVKVI